MWHAVGDEHLCATSTSSLTICGLSFGLAKAGAGFGSGFKQIKKL